MPEALAGVQLQDFLSRAFPEAAWRLLRELQSLGRVRVNGMAVQGNRRLKAMDQVEVQAARGELRTRRPADAGRVLPVLFESPSAIVISKPAGLVTVPDRTGTETGVHGELEGLRPGADLRIVHRLDRDTSGCLLLAKGLAAAQHFDLQFRSQAVQKHYCALVHGMVATAERDIDLAIGPDPRRPGKMMTAAIARGDFRGARTTATLVATIGNLSLLRLQLHSGRTHQLRVHLAAIGHPIVGDEDYGGRPLLLSEHKRGYKLRHGVDERPLLDRLFLHCERLAFVDVDGANVVVTAPLSDDLRTALARLEAATDNPKRK